MSNHRLRIFAGPNGSGKSTLALGLKDHPDKRIKLGIFVNADEIEKQLNQDGFVSLDQFEIYGEVEMLQNYIQQFGMLPVILKNFNPGRFNLQDNKIYADGEINSYIAADIAGYIRSQLLLNKKSFSFETVFSHPSKLEIMKQARELGYRVYLYFITTQDPEININRVSIRVAKHGHPVSNEKVIERYYKSLELLLDAIKLSNRAYLFDNSGKYYELIAEVTEGRNVEVLDIDKQIPKWFLDHVYQKNT